MTSRHEGIPLIERILVPTDGSEGAFEAANFAVGLTRRFGAHVTLVHVVEVPRVPLALSEFAPRQVERMRQDLLDTGRAILALTRKPFAEAGISVEAELREGRAADVIVDVAARGEYDLIVIGSRGTGVANSLIFGSVGEQVARHAPCPVLIVRHRRATGSA